MMSNILFFAYLKFQAIFSQMCHQHLKLCCIVKETQLLLGYISLALLNKDFSLLVECMYVLCLYGSHVGGAWYVCMHTCGAQMLMLVPSFVAFSLYLTRPGLLLNLELADSASLAFQLALLTLPLLLAY